MQSDLQSFITGLQAAKGEIPLDVLVENVQVVNVYTEKIENGSIGIKNGKIVVVSPRQRLQAAKVIDGAGQFAIPGLMDAHVHIETTLLSPEALAALIVPNGTTTMFVDPMEIANVAGEEGLRAMFKSSDRLPYRMFLEVPSRVPTAPGLETTGGRLGLAEVTELLTEKMTASLGELDPSKVLGLQEEYLAKILAARERGKIANGHAIGLDWDELNVYAAAGLNDDHECVEFQELLDRLSLGITVMVREGSTERNLHHLLAGVIKEGISTDYLIFCTDDKHPNDIANEGHINFNVSEAIKLGLEPIKAIKMATLNIARHFRLDHLIGSITPGRWADFILLPDLGRIKPSAVFKGGELVSQGGNLLVDLKPDCYPDFLYQTVKVDPKFSAASLGMSYDGPRALARVINIYPEQIINFGTEELLAVENGLVQTSVEKDVLKLAVVERYGKNGNVGLGFVKGFGLKTGALAISMAHDHHNIVAVGANDEDIYLAVKELEKVQGGMSVVSGGQVLQVVPLPLGGLMSDRPAAEVLPLIEEINARAKELGCDLPAPFMTLCFISLPTVPDLGLTDMGLIRVKEREIIPVIID